MEFKDAVQQILDRGAEAIGTGIVLKDVDNEIYAVSEKEFTHCPKDLKIKEQISKGGELIGTLEVNPSASIFYEAFIRGVLSMVRLEISELI